ncbi:MAG: hypothetical protein KDB71_07105 [Mycobacterium sp.]|nr:hypothetical protein [Mycobacterium sp.]
MIEDYQAQTAALAAGTVTQVSAIYAAFQAGQITQAETAQLVASVINLANATAATLADAFISAQIEVQIGYPTPTVGVVPADDTARLELAAHTILDDLFTAVSEKTSAADDEIDDDQPDPVSAAEVRFERLARAEPLETAQKATVEVMDAQPLVEGWTRQMDADPCQLCTWWWRTGRIWPKNHPFQSHKGCNCQPKVVLAKEIQSTEYTRKLERNQA